MTNKIRVKKTSELFPENILYYACIADHAETAESTVMEVPLQAVVHVENLFKTTCPR